MSIELLGFAAGIAMVVAAIMLFLRHERWKAISEAYERPARRQGGNALIWPSR